MIGQVSIRTRACRTGATGDRRRWRSLEKAIHAGARNTPRARDPRQAIRTRRGRRDRLAHRLDLLLAKGLLASMAAILADSNSLSMVISPTLDFSRAISSSRSSRSRSFRADAAPASARSRHSVSLATETFASRATTSNGSQQTRHHRHLALDRIALRSCIDARGGACASYGGALRRPLGLQPRINRHFETSGCGSITAARCLSKPCRTPTGGYLKGALCTKLGHELLDRGSRALNRVGRAFRDW